MAFRVVVFSFPEITTFNSGNCYTNITLFGVAQEVKTICSGCVPINSTTCARAVSIAFSSFDPNL